ncbi:YqjF family protein [Halovivax limisalsi]|uniref:YqjF family protein n=1 Tax=Halovivax limisalsi TaxID=1453760 RepID=UPI001FFD1E81|nr:DUF2071 domain-containing protein [Halovivax limisalsi]
MSRGDTPLRETDRSPVHTAGSDYRLPHPFRLTWRDGLFCHWPIEPDALRPHVPDPLTLDTYDDSAWVSIVPFVAANAGLRGTPRILRPTFAELNVRTYVSIRGDPGLYFFSVDVGNAAIATLAGRATRLPVRRARMHVSRSEGSVPDEGSQVSFASARESVGEPDAHFTVTYEPEDEISFAEPGTRDAWLTERRRFFAPDGWGDGSRPRGTVLVGEVAHAPWPLQSASITLHENGLFAANDLPEPDAEPVAHYCPELAMTAAIPRRMRVPY